MWVRLSSSSSSTSLMRATSLFHHLGSFTRMAVSVMAIHRVNPLVWPSRRCPYSSSICFVSRKMASNSSLLRRGFDTVLQPITDDRRDDAAGSGRTPLQPHHCMTCSWAMGCRRSAQRPQPGHKLRQVGLGVSEVPLTTQQALQCTFNPRRSQNEPTAILLADLI